MRKIGKMIFLLFTLFVLTSCVEGQVVAIEVDEASIPENIIIGTFDITDLKLIVTKSNNQTTTIPVKISMINATDYAKLQEIGTHDIEIVYQNVKTKVTITIKAPNMEDIEAVLQADLASIIIPETMVDLFKLPLQGANGSEITWETASPYLEVATNGTITLVRPQYYEGDQSVELNAVLSYLGEELRHQFITIVPSRTKDAIDEQMELVASSITIPSQIENQLILPFVVATVNGLVITWETSNPEIIIINNQAKTVQVLPPSEDTVVTLSYMISYQNKTYSHYDDFSVVVLKGLHPAPTITNPIIEDGVLSWTGVEGALSYSIYIDGIKVASTSETQIDLKPLTPTSGQFTIGIQTDPFDDFGSSLITETYYHKVPEHVLAYYQDVDFTLVGNALKLELRTLLTVTHKTKTSYDSLRQHLQYTDQSMTDDGKILLFYSRIEVDKTWDQGYTYNREHVWAQSLGWFTLSGAGSDLHHIRPTDPSVNGAVNDRKFGNVVGGTQMKLSKQNGGALIDGYYSGSYFEPADEVKGDVARIIFYLMTRYPESDSYSFTSVAYSKELLLEWNQIDPVDAFEARRNERTAEIQGNRNPFIDYSYLADQIWS